MSWLVAAARRSLWLLLLTAAGGAAYTWWRDQQAAADDPAAPTEWPPLEAVDTSSTSATESTATETATWVPAADDGGCPLTHPIKANDNSGIFHVPGGRFYDRTKAERCYITPEAAEADGYRRAKT